MADPVRALAEMEDDDEEPDDDWEYALKPAAPGGRFARLGNIHAMPLTFDLSLDDLYAYEGRNPRPDDFDDHWDKGVAQMRAVDPEPERIPAAFQTDFAACSHFWFTGINGARVHAKLLEPTNSPPPPSGHCDVPRLLRGFGGLDGEAGLGGGPASRWRPWMSGPGGPVGGSGGTKGTTLRGHIVRGLGDEDPSTCVPFDFPGRGPVGRPGHGDG